MLLIVTLTLLLSSVLSTARHQNLDYEKIKKQTIDLMKANRVPDADERFYFEAFMSLFERSHLDDAYCGLYPNECEVREVHHNALFIKALGTIRDSIAKDCKVPSRDNSNYRDFFLPLRFGDVFSDDMRMALVFKFAVHHPCLQVQYFKDPKRFETAFMAALYIHKANLLEDIKDGESMAAEKYDEHIYPLVAKVFPKYGMVYDLPLPGRDELMHHMLADPDLKNNFESFITKPANFRPGTVLHKFAAAFEEASNAEPENFSQLYDNIVNYVLDSTNTLTGLKEGGKALTTLREIWTTNCMTSFLGKTGKAMEWSQWLKMWRDHVLKAAEGKKGKLVKESVVRLTLDGLQYMCPFFLEHNAQLEFDKLADDFSVIPGKKMVFENELSAFDVLANGDKNLSVVNNLMSDFKYRLSGDMWRAEKSYDLQTFPLLAVRCIELPNENAKTYIKANKFPANTRLANYKLHLEKMSITEVASAKEIVNTGFPWALRARAKLYCPEFDYQNTRLFKDCLHDANVAYLTTFFYVDSNIAQRLWVAANLVPCVAMARKDKFDVPSPPRLMMSGRSTGSARSRRESMDC